MIDANAFGEWIVAKAAKRGAFESAENLRVAREAAEVALARDGDEIHVTCVLAGASGALHVDERMTRMAVGVLFPKVLAHPEPLFVPRPEPKPPAPEPPRESREFDRAERRRLDRRIFAFVIALLVLAFVSVALGVIAHEREHEAPSRDKREMHH